MKACQKPARKQGQRSVSRLSESYKTLASDFFFTRAGSVALPHGRASDTLGSASGPAINFLATKRYPTVF